MNRNRKIAKMYVELCEAIKNAATEAKKTQDKLDNAEAAEQDTQEAE